MSALADALAQAQTRAVAALAKQYVGGQLDEDAVRIALDSFGLTDETDTARWIAALDVIRATGADVPRETRGSNPATEAQWQLLRRLCDERQVPAPNVALTKGQASELIEKVKAGTYAPDDYVVPF